MRAQILLAVIIVVLLVAIGIAYINRQNSEGGEQETTAMNNDSESNENNEGMSEEGSDRMEEADEAMTGDRLPPPEMEIDPETSYSAIIKTTEGEITIDLNASDTPKTVNNFVYLANNDFYDSTVFHRIIDGFMIQGGDPKGDGTGGPGYRFDDEPFEGEYTRGTVAMANAGPNTNGSQFFIMHEDTELPPQYVIFGQVTEGLDVVDAIATAPVEPNPNTGENSKPASPVTVEDVEIVEQ